MENKLKKGFWASLFSSKPSQNTEGVMYAGNVKEIKVLGPGCAKCKSTFAVVERVVRESGIEARVVKVDDIEEIMRYNILSTPAVVIDGKVVVKGRVPSESEIRALLGL